jgi:hypothetical protein
MAHDCARRDTEHLRGPRGIQIEEQPQCDHLLLTDRQPHQRGHDPGIGGLSAASPG